MDIVQISYIGLWMKDKIKRLINKIDRIYLMILPYNMDINYKKYNKVILKVEVYGIYTDKLCRFIDET